MYRDLLIKRFEVLQFVVENNLYILGLFFLNRRSDGDIKVVELIKRKFSVDLVVNKFYFDIKKRDGKSYFL